MADEIALAVYGLPEFEDLAVDLVELACCHDRGTRHGGSSSPGATDGQSAPGCAGYRSA
jgi:hypothetical protein